jgi:hypothetical protein
LPVTAAELVEATTAREDEETNINVTENREFASFLHESASSFRERDLTTVVLVFDSLQLDLTSPHSYKIKTLTLVI